MKKSIVALVCLCSVSAFGSTLTAQNTVLKSRPLVVNVFVIAGQSNASGRGNNAQGYTGTTNSVLFGNDYIFKTLEDFTDSNTAQVDAVSGDSIAAGSVWPLLATRISNSTGVSTLLIPCAKGGTSITEWLPSANPVDRSTLFGSMIYRTLSVVTNPHYSCTLRGVLWWQGENEAISGMATATYQGHLLNVASNINLYLGVKLIPAALQSSVSESGYTDANKTNINVAIQNLWGTTYVGTGPNLAGLVTDDQYHIKTDGNLNGAATNWWNAVKSEFSFQ